MPPNTQLKYCNLGYQMLGEIVQRASGEPYPEYVLDRILTPLGMSSTGFEPLRRSLAGRLRDWLLRPRLLRRAGYRAGDAADMGRGRAVVDRCGSGQVALVPAGRACRCLSEPDGEPGDSAVLASATRREMHKPRYLSDEEWTSAWGISWYSVRKDDVTWVQHSGGLPGFTSNACFDRQLAGRRDRPAEWRR